MATAVRNLPSNSAETFTLSFLDKHFTKVAFVVSTMVLFILSPLHFFLGIGAAVLVHRYFHPKVAQQQKITTIPRVVLAIVGAVAACLKYTPVSMLGGFVFQSLPFLSALSFGDVTYRIFSANTY